MNIAFINAVPYGSTGKIVSQIADCAEKNGDNVLICVSWAKRHHKYRRKNVFEGSFLEKAIHILLGRITGCTGCFSVFDTCRIIFKLKKFKPDVIHLHLLHSDSFNLPVLFKYIKRQNIPVVWTMHDCWALTGYCPHFVVANCDKWQTGCFQCSQLKKYTFVDSTKFMWNLKKNCFTGVSDLSIVAPSEWLKETIKKSYLGDYKTTVINNGVDLSVFNFKPNSFREEYGIGQDQFIVLGVSFDWSYKKGIDVFADLAELLDKEKFKIVLVGIDKTMEKTLPKNIISIARTENQEELAKIYSAADLFINPTREEVFGLVNIEALGCETPVVTFNTGGSPECIDESCGIVLKKNDSEHMKAAIEYIQKERPFKAEASRKRAELFSGDKVYARYYELLKSKGKG